MAVNSSRGNPIGAGEGPNFDISPPPVPDALKSEAHKASSSTDTKAAEHASGQEKSQQNLEGPVADMKKDMENLGTKG